MEALTSPFYITTSTTLTFVPTKLTSNPWTLKSSKGRGKKPPFVCHTCSTSYKILEGSVSQCGCPSRARGQKADPGAPIEEGVSWKWVGVGCKGTLCPTYSTRVFSTWCLKSRQVKVMDAVLWQVRGKCFPILLKCFHFLGPFFNVFLQISYFLHCKLEPNHNSFWEESWGISLTGSQGDWVIRFLIQKEDVWLPNLVLFFLVQITGSLWHNISRLGICTWVYN